MSRRHSRLRRAASLAAEVAVETATAVGETVLAAAVLARPSEVAATAAEGVGTATGTSTTCP